MAQARMVTEIEDFFALGCGRCERWQTEDCSSRIWHAGLAALREICRESGMSEHVKWGHPCYMHAGRNIALIGALRGDFRLNFFNAALMKDPEGLLERQGPNTRHPDSIRFTDAAQVIARAPAIGAYLAEAMAYAEKGILPAKEVAELDLPEELVEVMDADSELAEAFWALTPGRRRSYAINLNGAKGAETRYRRIEKFRPMILAGRGAQER